MESFKKKNASYRHRRCNGVAELSTVTGLDVTVLSDTQRGVCKSCDLSRTGKKGEKK